MYKSGKFYIRLGLPDGASFPTSPSHGDIFLQSDIAYTYLSGISNWRGVADYLSGDVSIADGVVTVIKLQNRPVADIVPVSGEVLTWDGAQWIPSGISVSGAGVTDHGALIGLADDDHVQYLLEDGSRALTGNLAVGVAITIDGVDISDHSALHDAGGGDALSTVPDHDHSGDAGDGAQLDTGALVNDAVTNAKLRNSAGYSVIGKAGAGAGDPADIAIGANTVLGRVAAGIVAAQVATAQIANDAVDDTKAGNRVPQFYRRQGGHATDWYNHGDTNYTPTAVRMQCGSKFWSGSSASQGSVTVTFPVAFSACPLVIATSGARAVNAVVEGWSTTTCNLAWKTVDASSIGSVRIFWLAIGPE